MSIGEEVSSLHDIRANTGEDLPRAEKSTVPVADEQRNAVIPGIGDHQIDRSVAREISPSEIADGVATVERWIARGIQTKTRRPGRSAILNGRREQTWRLLDDYRNGSGHGIGN